MCLTPLKPQRQPHPLNLARRQEALSSFKLQIEGEAIFHKVMIHIG